MEYTLVTQLGNSMVTGTSREYILYIPRLVVYIFLLTTISTSWF